MSKRNIFDEFGVENLKPHEIFSLLSWENRDEYKHVLERKTQKANTYVVAMIDILMSSWSGSLAVTSLNDTGGTPRNDAFYNAIPAVVNAGAGNNAYGIQCGTSGSAVTMADYALGGLIANGATNGTLAYGATSIITTAQTGSEPNIIRYFTVARTMTNSYTGPITVQEVGLVGQNTLSHYYLYDHTLSTNTINSLASGTATYTFGIKA